MMETIKERRAPPNCLFYFIKVLKSTKSTSNSTKSRSLSTVQTLIDILINEGQYPTDVARQVVFNAIYDGLLVSATSTDLSQLFNGDNCGGRVNADFDTNQIVRFPSKDEMKRFDHDFYCFECHLPGLLEQCRGCHRVFHRNCYRRNPLRPNYALPSLKNQKNPLPEFSSCSESEEPPETLNGNAEHRDTSSFINQMLYVENEAEDYTIDSNNCISSTPLAPSAQAAPRRSSSQMHNIRVVKADDIEFCIDFENSESSLFSIDNFTINTTDIMDDENKSIVNIKTDGLLMDTDLKCSDVIYLGEVRPPNRKRHQKGAVTVTEILVGTGNEAQNLSLKTEFTSGVNGGVDSGVAVFEYGQLPSEEPAELYLCTCCRLLRNATMQQPPNLDSNELCYLIGNTFRRNRLWIKQDVTTYLENKKIPQDTIHLINCLLSSPPVKSLRTIDERIRRMEYKLLMEFLIDLLDVQHQIGMFFGTNCVEMECSKWLLRYVTHDLSEIRRCADCFRFSSQKNNCQLWFCIPCFQRHELVLAKQSGFPYWPAKVIRVLNRNNQEKYDVRFFGGNHSRALIDARYIKTIDGDSQLLKLNSSHSLKRALKELRCYELLQKYPASTFSYNADPKVAEQIMQALWDENFSMLKDKKKTATSHQSLSPSSAMISQTPQYPQRRSERQKQRQQQRQLSQQTQQQKNTEDHHQQYNESNSNHLGVSSILESDEALGPSLVNGDEQVTVHTDVSIVSKANAGSQNHPDSGKEKPSVPSKPPISTVCPTVTVKLKRLHVNCVQSSEYNAAVGNVQHSDDSTKHQKLECVQRELHETQNELMNVRMENENLQKQLKKCRGYTKQLRKNINILKRKQWCSFCLDEATYSCCFTASYCSRECQKNDWMKRHSEVCCIFGNETSPNTYKRRKK